MTSRRRLDPHASRLLLLTASLLLAQAAAPGCLRVEHGIEVSLLLSWVDAEPGAWLPLGDGGALRLDDGVAWIRSATLLPCGQAHDHSALAPPTGLDRVLRALGPVAQAQHAHGASGNTIEGPYALAASSRAARLGTFTPVPGDYCALHVALGQDDGPALAATARSSAGAPVSAWSGAEGSAHLTLETPLALERPGDITLLGTLFRSDPFANLWTVQGDARALGDYLVGGRRGGALRVVPDEDPSAP